jgi:hypothetical protein
MIATNCEQTNADILVLTEADSRLSLNFKSCFSTIQPNDEISYKPSETRVTINTNYELVRQYDTFDEHIAVCVELITEIGNMIVYGTVIGIHGNRHKNFLPDLLHQVEDIERLAKGKNLCVIGDFNLSFADNYYYTKNGRAGLEEVFERNEIALLTRAQPECIDHIAVSSEIIAGLTAHVSEWNMGKELSDHKGILVELI